MKVRDLLELIDRLRKAGLTDECIVGLQVFTQEGTTQHVWSGGLETVTLDVEMGFHEAFRDHDHLPTPWLILTAKLDVPADE